MRLFLLAVLLLAILYHVTAQRPMQDLVDRQTNMNYLRELMMERLRQQQTQQPPLPGRQQFMPRPRYMPWGDLATGMFVANEWDDMMDHF